MAEVGNATVSIFPSFKGFRSKVSAEVDGATKAAGAAAGKGFSAAFNAGSGDVGAAAAKKLNANVASASQALSRARLTEQDATGRVRVAETALAEARAKGGEGSARAVSAEERLSSAQRKLTEATTKTKSASDQLRDAQSKLKQATDSTANSGESAAGKYARGWAGVKERITGVLSKAVQDAASQAETTASSSGEKAGGKFSTGLKSGIAGVAKIGGLVAGAFAAAGAVVTGIAIKGGLNRALAIEDAKASLDGLGHSTEAITGIMANASASVKGTAFGLGEAASTAAGAVAANIKPGQDLERVLKLVADSATIAKTDMGSMGSIFNKVAASGKLQGDVIAQLQDAGVPVLQFVAKEIGKTAEETAKLASDGKIDFKTFSDAMEAGLGGAAAKSGNTFRGAMKNTYAALGRIGETMVLPFLNVIKMVFNAAMPILDGINAKLKPIMATFGAWLEGKAPGIIEKFVSGLSRIGSGISGLLSLIVQGDFTSAFRNAFKVEEDARVVGFLLGLRDAVIKLWSGFSMGRAVRDQFSGQLTGLVAFAAGARAVFDEVIGGFRAFKAAFIAGDGDITSSGFAGFLESLGGAARTLFDALSPAVSALVPLLMQAWTAFSPLQIIMAAILPIVPQIAAMLGELGNVIGGVLGAVLTTVLPMFIQLSGVISQALGTVLAAVLPVAVQLITMLGAAFNDLMPILLPIISTVVQLVSTLITQLAPIIAQLITAVLPPLVQSFGLILNAIGPVIQMIASLLIPIIQALMPIVVTVFSVIVEIITAAMQIVQGIIQVVTGIISGNWEQVWAGILNIVGGVFNLIISVISGAIQLVISVVLNGLNAVVGFFTAAFANIVQYLVNSWNSIVTGAQGMLDSLLGFFRGIGDNVLKALGNIGGLLVDSGKALIQGFLDGIKGMAGSIGDAVGGVMKGISDFFPHSPAKKGPFSGKGYTTYSGKALAGDFAKGIASEQEKVGAAANSLMTAATLSGSVTTSAATAAGAARSNPWAGAKVEVTMPITERVHPDDLSRALTNTVDYKLRTVNG